MIENSMFYMNFEVSSDSQKRCVEEIKRIGLDDIMNPIYLLKKPIIDKKADYDYQDAFVVLMPRHKMIFINFGEEGELFEEFQDDFIDDIGYIAIMPRDTSKYIGELHCRSYSRADKQGHF